MRRAVDGVLETDRVVHVGYPVESSTGPITWFEIERDDRVIAWVHVFARWLKQGEACVGSGIGGA